MWVTTVTELHYPTTVQFPDRKRLIADGTTGTKLELTAQEKETIYKKMTQMNIFSYPEVFKPSSKMFVDPHPTYYFRIRSNGKAKIVLWEDEGNSQIKQAVELRNLITMIKAMIEQKPEYKKLPDASGGYL